MKTTITKNVRFDQDIANRLRLFREKYVDKSQNMASKVLKVSQSKLSYMESGKSPVTVEVVRLLSKDYDLNENWLLTGKGKETDKTPKKTSLLKDFTQLEQEISVLKKAIKIMELNHQYLFNTIEKLQAKIDQLEKKN